MEKIEDNDSRKMRPEHRAEFEKRSKEDKTAQDDISLTKQVIEGVEGFAFKVKLKGFHEKFFSEEGDENIF